MAMRPVELRLGDLMIEGHSRAGDQTWFRIHPPGLAFDTGRGALQLAGSHDVFLSHGHMDHVLGLPYVLSQRSLHQNRRTRVFCPAAIVEPLAALVAAAEQLDRARYQWELRPLAPGDRVEVGRDLTIEAFATDHVVPSLGFHLARRKRRLLQAFVGMAGTELAARKAEGIVTSEEFEEIWLSYCGDTGPAVFDRVPALLTSRVLLVECTFLGAEQRDKGDMYKHLHLDDLVERAGEFQNGAIVLHHLSHKHRVEELRAEVARRLPGLAGRVHVLVEAGQ